MLAILAASLAFGFWLWSRSHAQDMGNMGNCKSPSVVVFGEFVEWLEKEGLAFSSEQQFAEHIPVAL